MQPHFFAGLAGVLGRVRQAHRALGSSCEICRGWSQDAWCSSCTSLFHRPIQRCRRCAMPWPDGEAQPYCNACRTEPPPYAATHVAFDYAFPWDRLVQQLKFADRTDLALPLGRALADRVMAQSPAEATPDTVPRANLLLPVPLSPKRLAERGYNQSLLLAQALAGFTGIALARDVLLRPVEAERQGELGRAERLQNLRGVFMVDPAQRGSIAGRCVALVDDVITTGSTAAEASRELLRAGAAAVEVWAVARTA